MSSNRISAKALLSGWQGVCLVAVTYFYFLIFAQFAFLSRLQALGIAEAHLQLVMAAMAIGGICFSLLATIKFFGPRPRMCLQCALLICGAAALSTLLRLGLLGSIVAAFLIGSGLGLLTVTLVSNLRLWTGSNNSVFKVGLGTGIGYFLCNIPAVFTASPLSQSLAAACLCTVGIVAALKTEPTSVVTPKIHAANEIPFAAVLVAFTALVWLDSAAFFIIQDTPSLKAGTWEGTSHLWANACIHLAAAVLSGLLIQKRSIRSVLALAILALATACLLLHQPSQIVLASLFYPIGVSFYSVALVAYPSLLATSKSWHRQTLRAGLIYAIAGWIGSAMGIGMAQHLRQVPMLFIAFAICAVLGPMAFIVIRKHPREAAVVAAGLVIAFCLQASVAIGNSTGTMPMLTAAERGRQVYISEGCINCHSQYVRPHTSDLAIWGPAETIEELRSQHPPLIGNRRQGPDLSQVGGRRSPLWLKAHFFHPAEVSHASFMPAYAYLFQNSTRGDDLVSYLHGLHSSQYAEHIAWEQQWRPEAAHAKLGAHLYDEYCGTCHGMTGATRLRWALSFERLPPDLRQGPWLHRDTSNVGGTRALRLARIIKFGIPGTDMPGHEYLSDQNVSSIAQWVNQSMLPPERPTSIQDRPGENR